jgi:major membrane immunogen (membrane-anchored lipoprotein)
LVDPSKTYTLLSAYELKPGDRTNTKPDNIKRQGQFVVKFEAEFNNPDGNIKPSDASSNKLFMVTTSNTSTTIHPGSKPSLLKLILSTIQNTQFVDSFLE